MSETSADSQTSDFQRATDKMLSQIRGWFAIEPPPAKLYHYTSAAGLKGIVQSNRLWASSVYYLNDASELQYGVICSAKR